jgi:hypothetical protein
MCFVWQEEVEVVEQSTCRFRRARKNAHATRVAKFTTVKAVVPKIVGLSKPPQTLGKVKYVEFVGIFLFALVTKTLRFRNGNAHSAYIHNAWNEIH